MRTSELIQIVNENLKSIFKQTSLDKIPNIQLKENNEIATISGHFGYFHVELPSDLPDEEKVDILVDKLTEYMNAPENNAHVVQIEKLCGNLAIEINNGFSTLSGIVKSTVEDLRDKINTKFESILKREGAEHLISELSTPDTSNISFLKWSGLSSTVINDENVVDLVTEICNIKNKEVNRINARIALTKIIRSEYKEIPKEIYVNNEEIIVEYFSKNYNNINADDSKRYFKMLVDKTEYLSFFNVTVRKSFEDTGKTVLNLRKILFDCNNMLDCYDAIEKFVELNISNESKANLMSNIKEIRKSAYIALFYCLYLKTDLFKGKLILSKDLINFPEYKKIEKKGLDLVYVSNYIKTYYYSLPIPIFGIDTKLVLESEEKMKDALAAINNKIRLDKDIIFNKALYGAFTDTLGRSFEDIYNLLGFENEAEIKVRLKHEYDHTIKYNSSGLNGDIGKVDDALYGIIMNTFYVDSLVYQIYLFVNKNFITMMDDKSEISDKDITAYTLKSNIELMTAFLSNYVESIS